MLWKSRGCWRAIRILFKRSMPVLHTYGAAGVLACSSPWLPLLEGTYLFKAKYICNHSSFLTSCLHLRIYIHIPAIGDNLYAEVHRAQRAGG